MTKRARELLILPSLLAAAVGCQGSIGTPNGPGGPGGPGPSGSPSPSASPSTSPSPSPSTACLGQTMPGPRPMRRLSNTEYRSTLEDLLGPTHAALIGTIAAGLTSETESLGFRNNAAFLDVSTGVAEHYMDAAEQLATAIGRSQLSCPAAEDGTRACAQRYLQSFGRKVFRRPLTAEEQNRYLGLYDTAAASYDFATGIEWITMALLESPNFVHRVEFGIAAAQGTPTTRPDDYEMATRLSYLLWHSTPDDALLAAAERGELRTAEQITAAATRLIADPKAHRAYHFFEEWLDVDQLAGYTRDTRVFPGLPTNLPTLFQGETQAFIDDLLFGPGAHDLSALFTAPYTFANGPLAAHYGLSGVNGMSYQKVPVDGTNRLGILTQGAVISVHDKPTRTSIVRRGLKIRTDFLCQNIGAPPNAVPALTEPTPGVTQKERLAMHRQNESCNACHKLMDPIGIAMDGIDPVGRLRTRDETGTAVDTTSVLDHTQDADGAIANAPDLARRLAGSKEVSRCFVTQLFRYAYGRAETAADACTLERLNARFAQSGGDIPDLLLALTETDAFLYRPVTE